MSVLFQTIMSTILHLKRTCPKCKKEQIVPAKKRKETVSCKFCRTPIPPK